MPDSKPLRVMVLGLNYAPETTGIAPYTTALARHLASQGHDVTAVTGHPHYPEWRLHPNYLAPRAPVDDCGVRLIRVRHPVPRNPTGPSRIWMECVFAFKCMLRLLRGRPEVVVVVSPALLALIPAVLLRPVLRYRVGAIVQDLYGAAMSEAGLSGGVFASVTAWLERRLLRRAHALVAIHDIFKRRLHSAGIPEHRIEVIANWAHVKMPQDHDRDAVRRALGWGRTEIIALHAGNMGAKQGLEALVDVARLADEQGSAVRVVLLGSGSRRASLEKYGAGVSRLTFLGSMPPGAFESALTAADCLLLHEKQGVLEMSVPSKLTTYFSAERPVIAATHPRSGAASIMRAAKAGVIVPSGEPRTILEAIEALCKDPEVAAAFASNGRSYASRHFSESVSLAQQEAWVRSLAGR